MRLRNLQRDRGRSASLGRLVAELIRGNRFEFNRHYHEILSVETLPLRADIKHENWAIGIRMEGLDQQGLRISDRLFVKQASPDSFDKERGAVALLEQMTAAGEAGLPEVCAPFQFLEAQHLIISRLCDGGNGKMAIRNCLIRPWAGAAHQKVRCRFERCGNWLARFHEETSRSDVPPSPAGSGSGSISGKMEELLYPTRMQIIPGVENARMLETVRSAMTGCIRSCGVHGDFGPQNILLNDSSLRVIDWEEFHVGYDLEDCVHFIANVLTQSRHVPWGGGFLEACITRFLAGYCGSRKGGDKWSLAVIILAVNITIKRQEWCDTRYSFYHRSFHLPFLLRLAGRAYAKLVTT